MNEIYEIRAKRGIFSGISEMSAVSWIIWANILVFIVELIFLSLNAGSISYFALSANNIFAGKYLWTIVLHMFSHAGFLHIFVNMMALFSLGKVSEKIIGRKRFIWFYLIAGIFAGVLSVLLAKYFGYGFGEKIFGSPNVYMLGASGAIFGIAGLFVVLLPKMRFGILFIPFFSLPGIIMIPAFLAIMWLASIAGGLPIGNVAHFGGFLAGMIYGAYIRIRYKKKVVLLQRYFR